MKGNSKTTRPRIYLHVGRGRTGTTSLQQYVAGHRRGLLELGYFYPEQPADAPPSTSAGNGSWIVPELGLGEDAATKVFGRFRRWMKAASATSHKALIVSSEFFWGVNPSQLQQMNAICIEEGYEVVPVLYFREQVGHLISVYCQRIRKGKESATINESLVNYLEDLRRMDPQSNPANYSAIARKFEDVFGAGKPKMRIFDRAHLAGGDIRTDFLETIGVSNADFPLPARASNESAGSTELELIRALNRVEGGNIINQRKLVLFANRIGVKSTNYLSYAEPKLVAQIREYFLALNEEVRKAYFPQMSLPLFDIGTPPAQSLPLPNIDDNALYLLLSFFRAQLRATSKSASAELANLKSAER